MRLDPKKLPIRIDLPAHYEPILRRLCLNIQDDAWVGFGKQDNAMAKRLLKQLDGWRKQREEAIELERKRAERVFWTCSNCTYSYCTREHCPQCGRLKSEAPEVKPS